MSDSFHNDVFDRAQAVLSNDWLRRSNLDVTEILEEIEKIGITEIRFQQGGHIVFGSLDQLIKVRDHLLKKKVGSPNSMGILKDKTQQSSGDDDSRTKDVKSPLKCDAETNDELKTDSCVGIVNEGIFTDYSPFEAKDLNGCGTKELMVDRDIWEFIEHKKAADVKQLATIFEATIAKVEDDSGVLRLILKSKSPEARSEDLDIMLENLGALYEQTYARCVTETAQVRLSDEQSKLTLDYISKSFPKILAKKCIYNDDFLFIGSRHEVREARKQFQILAHRLPRSHLRPAIDERERMRQSMFPPKYNRIFGHNIINVDDDDDDHYYDTDSSDEIDKPCDLDLASKDRPASKQDEGECIKIADDGKEDIGDLPNPNDCCEMDKKDVAADDDDDKQDLDENQGKNYSESVENASSLAHSDESHAGPEHEVAPNDGHAGNELELELETAENLKTEDTSASVENLAAEPAFEENQKISETAKSDVDPEMPLLLTERNETQQPGASSAGSSGSSKQTKTGKKSKKNACYDLPKVTIVKTQFPVTNEPSIFYDKPAPPSTEKVVADASGEAGCMLKNSISVASKASEKQVQQLPSKEERDMKKLFHQQRKALKKKPYDSPSSSDSEEDKAKRGKKTQAAVSKETTSSTDLEELELKGSKNIEALIEELMLKEDAVSQAKLQKLLDKVANSKDKEITKTSAAGISKARPCAQNTPDICKSIPSADLECKKIVGLQPPDGTIACIIDKGFHLSGFSKSGTIEINMTFEAGSQGDGQTHPGRRYKGMKLKAYLPASGDGREALRLLKGAFAARKLFQIEQNEYKGDDDVIVPNGITFKETADQFPDPDYLPNLTDQLKKLVE